MCERDNNPTIEQTTAEGHMFHVVFIALNEIDFIT